ncbi:MAG: CHRD domain-containing protein [Armatimonadetes bacterium]|nr:CHRD domain-containing protein [Armatimonadota bacterium]
MAKRSLGVLAGLALLGLLGCGSGDGGDFIPFDGTRVYQVGGLTGAGFANASMTVRITDLASRAVLLSEVAVRLTSSDGRFGNTTMTVNQLSPNRIGGTARTVGGQTAFIVIDLAADGATLILRIIIDGSEATGTGVTSTPGTATELRAVLSGAQMVPVRETSAGGSATVSVGADRSRIDLTLVTSGLQGGRTVELRLGEVGQTGGVLFVLHHVATDGPLPGTLATSVTAADLRVTGNVDTFDEAVTAVLNGRTYLLVDTALHEAGELRGQVGPVALTATLTGSQVVPPQTTSASGTATVQLDRLQSQLTVVLRNSGLDEPQAIILAAGAAGEEGPALFTLYDAETDGALPATLTVTLTIDDLITRPSDGVSSFDEVVDRLLTRGLYLEITTEDEPDGELRGQVLPGG